MKASIDKLLSLITPEDAKMILKKLILEDPGIAMQVKRIADEMLKEVNIDDVAEEIFYSLNSIEIEEIWDRSGSTRHGYVDPSDEAWDVFGETLEPYQSELKKLQSLSLNKEAMTYCKGILKGIWKFQKESTCEYADWCEDAPQEYFHRVLDEWKKDCKNETQLREMDAFVKNSFPEMM